MKLDEVMALSDKALWIKALELRDGKSYTINGANEYGPALSPWDPETGLVNDVLVHWWDTENPVIHIAAAWELVEAAKAADYWMSCEYKLMSTIPAEAGWEVCLRGVGIANCAEAAMTERHFVEAETLSCAITRAFILAMTGDNT